MSLFLAAIIPTMCAAGDPIAAALAAEAKRGEALRRGDANTLASVLSEEFRYIHSTGKLERKADTVGAFARGENAYERFETSEVTAVEVASGVVVLSGRIDQRRLGNGKWTDAKLLFHAVWRNEAGEWRLISLQTVMPPPPAKT